MPRVQPLFDDRIEAKLAPYCVQHALLMQIPGVDWVFAAALIAEIGVDMSVFLSVYHLAAWAPGFRSEAQRAKRSGFGRLFQARQARLGMAS